MSMNYTGKRCREFTKKKDYHSKYGSHRINRSLKMFKGTNSAIPMILSIFGIMIAIIIAKAFM